MLVLYPCHSSFYSVIILYVPPGAESVVLYLDFTRMLGIELKSLCVHAKLLNHWAGGSGMIVVVVAPVVAPALAMGLCFSALCILGKCFVTEPHPPPHFPSCKKGHVECSFVWVSREMFAVYFVWKMPCVQSHRLSSLLAGKPEVCMPGLWQVIVAGERLYGPVPK